ncbi:MAG: pyridoxamine 5'-phosphate oxidase family protein [Verrucomicrobiales bacterium]|nr:pyridoxamine 5'-phosphate oxidase family protein [Verrucomicrobiales bacterium]
MGNVLQEISDDLQVWLGQQRIFFVGTAPLSGEGHVNVSPKGGDAFRILGPRQVVWLDVTGSTAETTAHLRENGRIVLMFCAFAGPPRIVRLHGRGEVIRDGHADFRDLLALFPAHPGTRSVIRVQVDRISSSCGFGVPEYAYERDRDTLSTWAAEKGPEGIADYWSRKNVRSIDGLPALREAERPPDPAPNNSAS